jgi:hypothetical protein
MELKIFDIPTKEIYKDLLHPGLKKAGEALATVLDSANLILLPLKLANERSKIYFNDNLKRYEEKLKKIDAQPTSVPLYIGLPVIDKLTYISNNDLAEAFLNLLTKASYDRTMNLAHPSFVQILNNFSIDEARILNYCKAHTHIPLIDIYLKKKKKAKDPNDLKSMIDDLGSGVHFKHSWNLTGLEKEVDLIFPENIDLYLENLLHNGIIERETDYYDRNDDPIYEKLINVVYRNLYEDIEEQLKELSIKGENSLTYYTNKAMFKFTELGRRFLEACISDDQYANAS